MRYRSGSAGSIPSPTPASYKPSTCSPKPAQDSADHWSTRSTAPPLANLKELRPGTVRVLFAFDPWRASILLVAGGKAGRWQQWYTEAIPLAEQRYEIYLKERAKEGRQL